MCRNIRTLYHYDPPTSDSEIEAASLQFVRKVSGFTRPSQANQEAFDRAVRQVTASVRTLLGDLVTTAPPRNRAEEIARKRARWAARPR